MLSFCIISCLSYFISLMISAVYGLLLQCFLAQSNKKGLFNSQLFKWFYSFVLFVLTANMIMWFVLIINVKVYSTCWQQCCLCHLILKAA